MAFKKGFGRTNGTKYNNKKVTIDEIEFDSKKESQRYLVLKDAQEREIITNLVLQPKFELIPSIKEEYIKHLKTKDKVEERTVQLAITYKADFQYTKGDIVVVEDVKASPKMASLDKAFLIKEKLFRWKYGFPIRRVYKANEEV